MHCREVRQLQKQPSWFSWHHVFVQDLQRDIEQHTDSVASVLTLCDVLLHDADACGSDSENDSIQQTTRSLDRRWRNICAMSMERRMR